MLHPIGIAGRGAARVSRQPMACSTAARALRRVARAYSTRPPHLTLFTGPQCSLCDDAKEVLDEVHRTVPFTLATYNIRDDSAPDVAHWRRKYQYEIPVLHARWDGDPGYGRGYQYYTGLPASGDKPYLTHYIENLQTPASEARAANDEHINDSLRKAEARLLVQDAQRPIAPYPRRGVPVGAQVDISSN